MRPSRSTITVLVSGVPLTSARLTRSNARHGRVRVALPDLHGAHGGLTLAARFGMRLTHAESRTAQRSCAPVETLA
ncbi:MAG: hypothetical protein WKF96_23685 [Solirubrobacteraceae bacterium]